MSLRSVTFLVAAAFALLNLMFAGDASAQSVTRVQSVNNTGPTDGVTTSWPSQPSEGNLLVVISGHRESDQNPIITQAGWTRHFVETGDINDTSHRRAVAIWSKVAGSSEGSVTVDWQGTSSDVAWVIMQEFTGAGAGGYSFHEAGGNGQQSTTSLIVPATATSAPGSPDVLAIAGMTSRSDVSSPSFDNLADVVHNTIRTDMHGWTGFTSSNSGDQGWQTTATWTNSRDVSGLLAVFTFDTPPEFSSGPTTSSVTSGGFDIDFTPDEGGTAWYVVVSDGSGQPSVSQIKNGQDSGGSAAADAGTGSITANTAKTFSASGLSSDTPYDVYVLLEDADGNTTISSRVDERTSAASLPFSDPFTRSDNSTVGNGWTEEETGSDDARITSNRLDFVTNDNTNSPIATHGFTEVSSGRLKWSYTFNWDRTGSEGIYAVWMQLGDSDAMADPDDSDNTGVAVNLKWAGTNDGMTNHEGFGYVQGGTTSEVAVVSGGSGNDHTIEVVADLDAGTFDLTIDGTTEATDVAFDNSVPIDAVRLYADGVNGANFGTQQFDDMSVETVSLAVAVTPDGLGSPREKPAGTENSETFTVQNDGNTSEDFDLLASVGPGDFVAVDSITGTGVSQGTQADSARITGLGAGASESVTVWYTAASQITSATDTLYLEARSLSDTNVSDQGHVEVQFAPAAASLPFSDPFTRSDNSTVGNGWTEEETGSDDARITSNRLDFVTNDNTNSPAVAHRFTEVSSGRLKWSYTFNWDRTGSEGTYAVWMQLGDWETMVHPDDSDNTGVAVNLKWAGPNNGMANHEGFGYVQGGTATEVAVISGGSGSDHTIEVVADLDAGTFDLTIDGTAEATDVAFDNSVPIDAVRLYADGVNGANFGTQQFDDMSVETVSLAVAVTPDGLGSPREKPAGTENSETFTVQNDGNTSEDFDLLASVGPGDFVAVDSITGTGVSQGAQADSARITGLGAGTSESVTVWYTAASQITSPTDTLYLEARSLSDANVSDQGHVEVQFAPAAASLPFSDPFTRSDNSTVGNGWTEEETGSDDARIASNRLDFVANDNTNSPAVAHRFTEVSSGRLKWSYTFNWERTGSEGTYAVWMQMGDWETMVHPDDSDNTGVAVNLKWAGPNNGMANHEGFGYVQGGTATEVAVISGGSGSDHTIEIVADLDAGTFDLTIDGTTEATDVAFDNSVPIDAVRLYAFQVNGANFGNQQFDDMSVEMVSLAVTVTPDGADTVSRLPSNGTAYADTLTVTNDSNVEDDFDLFGIVDSGSFLAVDSITGPNVSQGATKDSARLSALAAGASDSAFVWHSVSDTAGGATDSLVLEARAVSDASAKDKGWSFVSVVKPSISTGRSVSPTGDQPPGTDLTYTITVTNQGSASSEDVSIVEDVAPELMFKVGSVTNALPSGVGVNVEYSDDDGSSWTYSPTSGGCGAPAGYDACVTDIRWTLQDPLSHVGPDNTGDVEFIGQIE